MDIWPLVPVLCPILGKGRPVPREGESLCGDVSRGCLTIQPRSPGHESHGNAFWRVEMLGFAEGALCRHRPCVELCGFSTVNLGEI